jgi:BMFP domain-containing protein YqiC
MFDPKSIDDIAARLSNAVPPGLNNLKEDIEQ